VTAPPSTPAPTDDGATADRTSASPPHRVAAGAFSPRQLVASLPDAARKLSPRHQLRSPMMLVV